MIVLVSLIVLLREFPCFHDFSHGASLHPYRLFHLIHGSRSYAHAYMRSAAQIRQLEFTVVASYPALILWKDPAHRRAKRFGE